MIILDTHAWIWWSNESTKLIPRARKMIQEADSVGVAAISCWELAMLVASSCWFWGILMLVSTAHSCSLNSAQNPSIMPHHADYKAK